MIANKSTKRVRTNSTKAKGKWMSKPESGRDVCRSIDKEILEIDRKHAAKVWPLEWELAERTKEQLEQIAGPIDEDRTFFIVEVHDNDGTRIIDCCGVYSDAESVAEEVRQWATFKNRECAVTIREIAVSPVPLMFGGQKVEFGPCGSTHLCVGDAVNWPNDPANK